MARSRIAPSQIDLISRYREVRALSEALAAPLSDADATAQSMPDASPAKWHLAHVSWFFESFVLRDHVKGYKPFDPHYAFLFNSYYEAEGPRHARPMRGLLTRPSLKEIRAYRAHVDKALTTALPMLMPNVQALVLLGLHHEQQHQELLLTDIQHLLSHNPLEPALFDAPNALPAPRARPAALDGGSSGTGRDGRRREGRFCL